MSDDGAPKSAYELILERLKQKDRADGVAERVLSDEQKQKIAELRRVYEAKLAEREILYQSERRKAGPTWTRSSSSSRSTGATASGSRASATARSTRREATRSRSRRG